MEAVGLASGVAGLISLALQVSGTINEYASAIKDRSKNIKELRDELALLADVLGQLRDFLLTEHAKGNDFDEGCVLENAVESCTERVGRIGSKIKPLSGGKLARTWEKMIWPFEQKEVLQMVGNLRRFTHTFQFALSIRGCSILSRTSDDASKLLKDILNEVKEVGEMSKRLPGLEAMAQESAKQATQIQDVIALIPALLRQAGEIEEMSQAVRMAEEREQERRKTEILDWLTPASSLHKHLDIQKRRAAGTGKWLLEHEYFMYWAENEDVRNDLLCVGGPGRGKTVLCSFVIDHLRRVYHGKDTAVVYYYCDFSEHQAQTPLHLACCVLRQLCQSSSTIPTEVSELYSRTRNELRDSLWFQQLMTVTQKVIAKFRQCIMVIDAFDETDIKEQRPALLQTLKTIRASKGITRVLATTRPHVDIEREFVDVVKIEVSANVDDLRHFLSKRIDEHPNSAEIVDSELKDNIIEKLCVHADGMFLLPALQIDIVLDQNTKGDIKRALNSLSTNLDDVFRSTMDRIRAFQPHKRDLAYKAMMWISHARRPLGILELRHALAVRFEEDDISDDDMPPTQIILDGCCGLIELDGEASYVRFVHFSLYEHLRKDDHGLFTNGEVMITRTCLKYLTFDSLKPLPFKSRNDFIDALETLPFLEYASMYWGFHARDLDLESYQELALPLLNDTHNLLVTARVRDARSPDFRKWKERMWAWALNGGGGISLAASFGLSKLTELLISQSQEPVLSARNMYGSTPLHECAMNGFVDTAKILIDNGADVLESNRGKATPFYLAVSYGQLDMCRMLLSHDRRQLDIVCRDEFTALHKACDLGSETIVGFLLQSHALVNAKEQNGMTPLHLACRRGYLSIVQMLVSARADVSFRTTDGVTPLDLAATGGFLNIVQYLIRNGAEASISNRSRFKWTALHRAAKAGHADIAKFLLDSGAELQCEDKAGRTPLILAVKGGDMSTVKLLLEYDPSTRLEQLQHKEKNGSSTKSVAFYTAHYVIHKYLRDLENDLLGHDPVFHPGPDPMLPLTHAIEKGLLPMVQALLKTQPDLLAMKDSSGCTALHTAFIEGQREIAEEILNHGVSINVRGYHDWTPLHIAASHGFLHMLSLALSCNADVHAVTETLQTPLHKAASSHNLTVVIELLRCGCDPSAKNSKGMTPVHVAAYQNFEEGVRELLKPEWDKSYNNNDLGENINLPGNITSRNLALQKDRQGRTPRIWAEFAGHLELSAYLRVEERRAKARMMSSNSSGRFSISSSRTDTGLSSSDGGGASSGLSRSSTLEQMTFQSRRRTSHSTGTAIPSSHLLSPSAVGQENRRASQRHSLESTSSPLRSTDFQIGDDDDEFVSHHSNSNPSATPTQILSPSPSPTPSPIPSPLPRLMRSSSKPTSHLSSHSATPTSMTGAKARRGEDEILMEIERRYADMALDFESD